MKVPLEQNLFLSISDLDPAEQQAIIKAIGFYPNKPKEGWPKSNTWEGIRQILDHRLEMKERIAQRNRINGAKHTGKRDNSEKTNSLEKSSYSQKIEKNKTDEVITNPFIALTDNPEIIAALQNPASGLSVFLETGQGYDDSLSRIEREFVDRGDVRALCPWQQEIMKESKRIKKFIQPTMEEWLEYCRELNLDEQTMRRAYESYAVADWHDSRGSPIRNWKQKILQVWNKPECGNKKSAQFDPMQEKSGLGAVLRGNKMAEQMLKQRGIIQ